MNFSFEQLEQSNKKIMNDLLMQYQTSLLLIPQIIYDEYKNTGIFLRSNSKKTEEIKKITISYLVHEGFNNKISKKIVFLANDGQNMFTKKDLSSYSNDTEEGKKFSNVVNKISKIIDWKIFEYFLQKHSENKILINFDVLKIIEEKKNLNKLINSSDKQLNFKI